MKYFFEKKYVFFFKANIVTTAGDRKNVLNES